MNIGNKNIIEIIEMKCDNKTASCNDETCPLTKCSVLKRTHPLKNECENDLLAFKNAKQKHKNDKHNIKLIVDSSAFIISTAREIYCRGFSKPSMLIHTCNNSCFPYTWNGLLNIFFPRFGKNSCALVQRNRC